MVGLGSPEIAIDNSAAHCTPCLPLRPTLERKEYLLVLVLSVRLQLFSFFVQDTFVSRQLASVFHALVLSWRAKTASSQFISLNISNTPARGLSEHRTGGSNAAAKYALLAASVGSFTLLLHAACHGIAQVCGAVLLMLQHSNSTFHTACT